MIFRLCRSSSTLAVLPFTQIFISQITIKSFFNKLSFYFSVSHITPSMQLYVQNLKKHTRTHTLASTRAQTKGTYTRTLTQIHTHTHTRTHAHTPTITTTSTKLKMNFIICNTLVFCFCYAYYGKKSLTKVRSSDVSF